jgi:hypothetical protein
MSRNALVITLGVLGGVAGHLLFFVLAARGLYGLAIPGGCVGLFAGIVKGRSVRVALLCGVLAFLAGVVTQWRFAGWLDEGWIRSLHHFPALPPMTVLLLALGTFAGFWVPFRRLERSRRGLKS